MGMICSDEISSINFYCLAERPFLLVPSIREQFGIVEYFRYKDDLLIFTSGDSDLQAHLLESLGEAAQHFKLKRDKACKYSVDMLDCTLSKGGSLTGGQWASTGLLDISIFVKNTSQMVPLCSSSMHHPSLHMAWPSARLKHFYALCSGRKPYRYACNRFVDTMRYMLPLHPWLLFHGQRRTRPGRSLGGSWLVIPYHVSMLACGFSNIIREACQYLPEAFDASIPRVAWSRLRSNIS